MKKRNSGDDWERGEEREERRATTEDFSRSKERVLLTALIAIDFCCGAREEMKYHCSGTEKRLEYKCICSLLQQYSDDLRNFSLMLSFRRR